MSHPRSFAVLHIATELSMLTLRQSVLPLEDETRGTAINAALDKAYTQCRAHIKELGLPCVACKRVGALAHAVACVAEEKFPIALHYYDFPCCDASDVCRQAAEAQCGLMRTLLPLADAPIRTCHSCKKLQHRGGKEFVPCGYCKDKYFCGLPCLVDGGEGAHPRVCPKRPAEAPARFTVKYTGFLVLPNDAPGFAIVQGPDALAPGNPHATPAMLLKTPAFRQWMDTECVHRRLVLCSRLPPMWHCICETASSDVPPKHVANVDFIAQEGERTLMQIIIPVCSEVCATQAALFIKTNMQRITTEAARAGDSAVSCVACSRWPILGCVWKTCADCKTAAYCSRVCQVKAWPEHKKHCAKKGEK